MRKTQFAANNFYHIYNRGVDKREVFSDSADFFRFYVSMWLLNDKREGVMDRWKNYKRDNVRSNFSDFLRRELSSRQPLVKITSYCLNPNHYHFILEQAAENGIEKFMHKIGTSYTNYFNKKNNRSGALFQGRFKSVQIKPNALLYLSAYVNCNSEVHGIAKAENYRWCSFPDYIGKRQDNLCLKEVVLSNFVDRKDYFKFAKENVKAQKQKKENEKFLLESI